MELLGLYICISIKIIILLFYWNDHFWTGSKPRWEKIIILEKLLVCNVLIYGGFTVFA